MKFAYLHMWLTALDIVTLVKTKIREQNRLVYGMAYIPREDILVLDLYVSQNFISNIQNQRFHPLIRSKKVFLCPLITS